MQKNGFVRPYQSIIAFAQQVADLLIVGGSLHLFARIYGVAWDTRYSVAALVSALIFFFFAHQHRLYDSWRVSPLAGELSEVLKAWFGTLTVLLVLAFVYKTTEHFSRLAILFWLFSCPVLLIALRAGARTFLRQARSSGHNTPGSHRRCRSAGGGAGAQYL